MSRGLVNWGRLGDVMAGRLHNWRWERFCQELALGAPLKVAYIAAGFKDGKYSATHAWHFTADRTSRLGSYVRCFIRHLTLGLMCK